MLAEIWLLLVLMLLTLTLIEEVFKIILAVLILIDEVFIDMLV